MRRLCIISAFFPPVGGPIVQRVYKHTKFLPEFGWDSVVITRAVQHFYAFDDTLVNDLPKGLKVYRTFSLDYAMLKRMFGKAKDKIVEDRRWDPEKIKRFSLGNFIRMFLLIPDGLIGWIPFAFWRAFRLRKSVDAYYLRMPPWSTGYLAPLLKIFTRKPIIADYSDEWTSEHIEFVFRPPFRKWAERTLEKFFIWASTWVSFSTESSKKVYEEKYPKFAHKFRIILNGYDEDDFKGISVENTNDDRLIIVRTGSTDFRASLKDYSNIPFGFFEALARLKNEKKEIARFLEVRFVGHYVDVLGELVNEYGINDIVRFTGYKPHREAIEEILRADVLFLSLYPAEIGKRVIPGKIFEYIRARKPMLVLAPYPSEVERLVNRYNAGFVVHPKDVDRIVEVIEKFVMMKMSDGRICWSFSDEPVENVSRRNSTKTLVKILEEKIEHKQD